MKILSLKALNINSLKGKTEIDFEALTKENALFAITGATGSGKSTLLDIISCALYGRTARLKNPNELMSRHTGEAYCEVVFEVHKKHYRCSWSQKRARKKADGKFQTAKMELVDLDTDTIFPLKSRDVPKKVAEISGLDFGRFTQSMLLAQGGFDAFLKADEKERSALLEKITGTQIYAQISIAVFQKQSVLNQEIEAQKKVLASIELLDTQEVERKTEILTTTRNQKQTTQKQFEKVSDLLHVSNTLEKKTQEQSDFKLQIKDVEKTLHQQEEKYTQLKKNFTKVQREYEVQMKQLTQARELFTKEQEVHTHLLTTQNSFQEKETHAEQLNLKLQTLEKKFQTMHKEFEAKKHYLKTHTQDEKLVQNWELLQNTLTRYKETKNYALKTKQHLEGIDKELNEQKKQQQKLEQESRELQKQLEEKNARYSLFQEDKTSELYQLQQRFYELEQLKKECTHYQELCVEKKNILQKQEQLKTTLKTLQNNEKILKEYITSLKEMVTILREKKAQEELLAKYEDDRKKLVENEPCFLCGSTEHPYVKHTPKLEIKDKEIDEKLQLLEEQERNYTQLLIELKTIQTQQEHTQKMYKEVENNLKALFHCQDIQEKTVAQEQKEVEKQTQELKNYQSKQTTLMQEKEMLEKSLHVKEKELYNVSLTLENLTTKQENLITLYDDTISQQHTLSNELELYNIDTLALQESEKELFEKKKSYEEVVTAHTKLQEALHHATVEKKETEVTQALLVKELTQLQESITQLTTREQELQKQRVALLNVADLQHYEEEKNSYYNKVRQELQNEEKKLTTLQEQLKERSLHVRRLSDEIQTLQKEYDAIQKEFHLPYSVEELYNFQALLQQKNESLQELIGSMKKELEINQKNNEKFQDAISSLQKQEKQLAVWTKLNELIGSSDGTKFKKFAQGVTLDQLIYLANKHLKILSARYMLARNDEKLLELEIIDTFQGDAVRPVTTLSGGESFIVSLALALGLSELASQKISIDSLFLDEGFGTLDAESLEMALNALNLLQTEGKMIGVISHVEALKERIPLQIKVIPRGDGTSYTKVEM